MRVTFEKVTRFARKAVKCSDCRKPLSRSKTFWQTMSPFNTHPLTKIVKDREQIWRELDEDAAAWCRKPEWCKSCEEAIDRGCRIQERG